MAKRDFSRVTLPFGRSGLSSIPISGNCANLESYIPSLFDPLFLDLVMVFFSIVDHPKDVGMVDEDLTTDEDQTPIVENDYLENGEEAEEDEELARANDHPADGEKTSFLRVLALPGVLPYSISFFALKLVNYSFFFWLPYFLHNKYHWSDETGMFVNYLQFWFWPGPYSLEKYFLNI